MELWDLYDANRRPLNRISPRSSAVPAGTYHIVVGVWTVNSAGKILLTLRHPDKESYPNTWENTGGSILSGETSITGAVRELEEETGIQSTASELTLLGCTREASAFIDTYLLHRNAELDQLTLQPGETVDARWVSLDELYILAATAELAEPVAQRLYDIQSVFEAHLTAICSKERP